MVDAVTVENLIEQVRDLIRYRGQVHCDTPIYEKFHKEVANFVFENFLDKTEHWEYIQKNLIWKSTHYLSRQEADNILTGLENLRLEMLERQNASKDPFWQYIHPLIIGVSQKLFIDKHYSKSVQSSFVEINDRIKKIRKKIDGNELDGVDLMRKTFGTEQPKLFFENNSTESGSNVQQEFMGIFAGAMQGIRNPNAHENVKIGKEDAVRQLMLASLLMYKVDDAVHFSNITE